jgi:hypothetical protein
MNSIEINNNNKESVVVRSITASLKRRRILDGCHPLCDKIGKMIVFEEESKKKKLFEFGI